MTANHLQGSRRGWAVVVLLCAGMLTLLSPRPAAAGIAINNLNPTFAGSGSTATLTSFTATVTFAPGGGIPQPSVDIQFTNSTGGPIGAPIPVTVDPNTGAISVTVPALASGLGNKAEISFTQGGQTESAPKPLVWYYGGAYGFRELKFKIDPTGIPGLTSQQSWFIQGTPELEFTVPGVGVFDSTVATSNFDVFYTLVGTDLYEATILGSNSFITLADGTFLSFPNGTDFGTVHITSNNGSQAGGTFDFFAIGLSGLFSWDAATNYTGGDPTASTSFDALTITADTVIPMPPALVLVAAGATALLARIAAAGRRRRASRRS